MSTLARSVRAPRGTSLTCRGRLQEAALRMLMNNLDPDVAPILNALLNASAGATWVSVHHGGGVGIGYSTHAGMVIVADGTREADARQSRVLTCHPGTGVARDADAGYPDALHTAARHGVRIPMMVEAGR